VELGVPPAPLPGRVDAAVIGAGFAGLSAALALARGGASVHIFEAARLGDGASGRTGGIALEGTATGPRPGAEHCLEHLRETCRAYAIECRLETPGCLEVRHAAEPPRPPERAWPDGGEGWLVAAAEVPGGSLDPGALVAGLARAALGAGAALHERAPVGAWEPGPPLRLRVRDTEVEAGGVLLAADALPPALLPPRSVRAALTLALATEPLARSALEEIGLGLVPFYTVDLPYLWGRATHEGRLVVGAGLAYDEGGDLERVSVDRTDVQQAFARLERRVRGLHPRLAGVRITHRWGGPIAFRAGAVPVLAEIAPRMLVAGAYAGHGVALSLRAGALAAARLLGGDPLPAWGALAPA
jgi:glycine/D-amino acid oxidase-like deaminating enzyme